MTIFHDFYFFEMINLFKESLEGIHLTLTKANDS